MRKKMQKDKYFLSGTIAILVFSGNLHSMECRVKDTSISPAYSGDCKDGWAHGTGSARGRDTYRGEFLNGQKHGRGAYIWANGEQYTGDWVNDQATGKGQWKGSDGETYEGDWKNSMRNGKGISRFPNGDQYEGEFLNNKKHGQGTYTTQKGETYQGGYQNNFKSGLGTLDTQNGDQYIGEFSKGQIAGKGVYRWKNGDRLEGYFLNGIASGDGNLVFANGTQYYGRFLDGYPDGFGSFKTPKTAYIESERSRLGAWEGEIYIEQGLFRRGDFLIHCTSKPQCVKKEVEYKERQRKDAIEREASNKQACSRLYIGKPVSWSEGTRCGLFGCNNFTLSGQIVGIGDGVASAKITESYRFGQVLEQRCSEF